jgi:hypothetical protein
MILMKQDQENSKPMPDHDSWLEFVIPWDDNLTGPTDMAHLLHKPAGVKGFITIADGHLCTGDGERWRIWGQNLCFNAPLPPVHMAPAIARRLAKFGINCIRFHHMDHRFPRGVLMRRMGRNPASGERDMQTTRALDPEAMARMDYFVYCCKQNGVYIDLNLNVSRPFTTADGVMNAEWIGYGKALTYFDPQLIMLQKEYARQMLDHVNPFTGNRYAEEPAVAIVEMVNENSVLESWVNNRLRGEQTQPAGTWCDIPPAYAKVLDRLWNNWLADKYTDREELSQAWDGDLRDFENPAQGSVRRLRREDFASASSGRFMDEASFYAEIERNFFRDMESYLRGELGVKQVILGTSDHNHGMNGQLHVQNNSILGIIDGHCYWQHPRFPGRAWSRSDWLIANTPMVDAPDHSAPAQLSRSCVKGMPYIVSEINEPFPNDYAAEFIPIMASYALLQDWDGLFFFSYGGGAEEQWKSGCIRSYFSMGNDPVKMTETAIGALMFLRGGVKAAETMIERHLTRTGVLESLRFRPDDKHPYSISHLLGRLALVHRTAIADFYAESISPAEGEIKLPELEIKSDTGELIWEDKPNDGRVIVNSPCCQILIGRNGKRSTHNITFHQETPFAAVQLISLDGKTISESELMLLVTVARVANTGMKWLDDTRRSLGENWGEPPTRVEPVTGRLEMQNLKNAEDIILKPLDEYGQPIDEVQHFNCSDENVWSVYLKAELAKPWYVIQVKKST